MHRGEKMRERLIKIMASILVGLVILGIIGMLIYSSREAYKERWAALEKEPNAQLCVHDATGRDAIGIWVVNWNGDLQTNAVELKPLPEDRSVLCAWGGSVPVSRSFHEVLVTGLTEVERVYLCQKSPSGSKSLAEICESIPILLDGNATFQLRAKEEVVPSTQPQITLGT